MKKKCKWAKLSLVKHRMVILHFLLLELWGIATNVWSSPEIDFKMHTIPIIDFIICQLVITASPKRFLQTERTKNE